jgi:hypothetical protein
LNAQAQDGPLVGLWPRTPKYRIEGGVLKAAEKGETFWEDPNNKSDILARHFANVRNDRDLVDFANEHGSLGFSALVPLEDRCGGDPVPWGLFHARRVDAALTILELLGEKDVLSSKLPKLLKGCGIELRSLPRWPKDVLLKESSVIDPAPRETSRRERAAVSHLPQEVTRLALENWPGDPVRSAVEALAAITNPRLSDVHFELAGHGAQPGLRLAFRALLSVIYFQTVSGVGEIRVCGFTKCRKCFVPARTDQKFCSDKCRVYASRQEAKMTAANRRGRG